jgi:uncharacterized protein
MTAAPLSEEALTLDCAGETLAAVLSRPARAEQARVGVVVVVGGPQYRAGSHRQFVALCRALAAAGIPALRFDVRGMGDSSGELRSFEALDDDIAAAVDGLQARLPGLREVVLWGLCDGASASLLYLERRRDTRVGGVVLLNPWVRSAATLARAHVKHYYWQRLRQREFWAKLLAGGVALKAARDLLHNLKLARRGGGAAGPAAVAAGTFQDAMARAARDLRGPMLLVLSGQDYTAKEFLEHLPQQPAWQGCLARQATRRLDMPLADHTFSQRDQQDALQAETVRWLQASFSPGASPP